MDEQAVASLTELGLSNYQAQAYLAVLTTGPVTANTVTAETDIPQGRVYDVLNALVDRSLLRGDDSRPRTYTAVPPETAIDRLLDQQLSALSRKRNQIEQTAGQLKTTLPEYDSQPDTESFATSALGTEPAQSLLLERFQAAGDSVLIVAGSVDLGPTFEQAVAEALEQLLVTDVSVRVVVSTAGQSDELEGPSPHIAPLLDAGLEIRQTDFSPHQRYLVIDDIEVCLEVVHPISGENLLALVNFRDEELAGELADRFHGMWDAGTPWPAASQ